MFSADVVSYICCCYDDSHVVIVRRLHAMLFFDTPVFAAIADYFRLSAALRCQLSLPYRYFAARYFDAMMPIRHATPPFASAFSRRHMPFRYHASAAITPLRLRCH